MEKVDRTILVTGARGFIGRNLVVNLRARGYYKIYEYDIGDSEQLLKEYCSNCQFVFNLAGINRPNDNAEFMQGNRDFGEKLLGYLFKANNKCPILLTSSVQAALKNDYGLSKLAGENILRDYAKKTSTLAYIYRLPNVFGKWCRPNYNSAVATFCYNIANGLPITVNDRSCKMTLVYIDDVINEFLEALEGRAKEAGENHEVNKTYSATLGELADLILSFHDVRETRKLSIQSGLSKVLYATYLSYIPQNEFKYPLTTHSDFRGSFTEFLRLGEYGQVSVNVSKPGIIKGEHWHNTKNEKFLVVSGSGIIRFRQISCNDIIEYAVSGDKLEVVDIPTGYTHNIENTSKTDMVTIMWASEQFDPNCDDTICQCVKEKV